MSWRDRIARVDEQLAIQLATVRHNRTRRVAATFGAVVVGIVLAWVHWLGLVLSGALVGLPQLTVRRAIVRALGFGALVVGLMSVLMPIGFTAFLELSRLGAVTIAVALILPVWGALIRGII